jgi:FtsP/CotA-like multicopper oxidase with cupredoxin domain
MFREYVRKTGLLAALLLTVLTLGIRPSEAGPGTLATEAASSPSEGTFYANSPAGVWSYTDALGATRSSNSGTPLRKFVDKLPGLGLPGCTRSNPFGTGTCNENNLGQYIPLAEPVNPPAGTPATGTKADGTTGPSDYYELATVEYSEKLHSDLPKATKLQGYVDVGNGKPLAPHYLGATILAYRDKPVRIKMENRLSSGLFLPLDLTYMGAGFGPPVLKSDHSILCSNAQAIDTVNNPCERLPYSQNRIAIHLHGGHTPWISDGTPHQWFTPAAENLPTLASAYKTGASFRNVPDMTDPGPGFQTLYYTNQQSGRLMFYHDHAFGTTRLNVYSGMAAGYLVVDKAIEDPLITAGTLPGLGFPAEYKYGIPLIIQDKTFVSNDIAVQDAKWSKTPGGTYGDLWFPHVYETNQDPNSTALSGANDFGRWDYGPWFWPPLQFCDANKLPANCIDLYNPKSPSPGHPVPEWDVTATPESFMDTPLVNGTAYPFLDVAPQAYRFRLLNAANDRPLNLQMYVSDPASPGNYLQPAVAPVTAGTRTWTEVAMVPANPHPDCTSTSPAATPAAPSTCTCTATFAPFGCFPATWPRDGRIGGVPDPQFAGPKFIQIGSESGWLPKPVVIDNQAVSYDYNRRNIVVLDILDKSLLLAPAERADVIVDFSAFAGKTIILYNDSPAPMPAFDVRYDYYTNDPDQLAFGGASPTLPGFGPNTRTIMQFRVAAGAAQNTPPYYDPASPKLATLTTAVANAFTASQPAPIVPETANGGTSDVYSSIFDNSLTFTPVGSTTGAKTIWFKPKAIQELWDPLGRMNATLGVEFPFTNNVIQTTIPLGYVDPVTETLQNDEIQIWKITHNGVDTHPVHFHLTDIQVINRVGWDGAIRPPDANEVGWKETIRMKPLEDVIVALRPTLPALPFNLTDSQRLHDPSEPLGATLNVTNPADGNPLTITNVVENFGNEFVWHCHILGHEENDFMRPVVFNVQNAAPAAPVLAAPVTSLSKPLQVVLAWTEGVSTTANASNGFLVQRAPVVGINPGAFSTIATVTNGLTYTDTPVAASTTYFYRIMAFNKVGSTPSNNVSTSTPSWVSSTVTLTTPANGATVTSPATVTMTAATTSSAGVTINRVDFYVGTTRIATKTAGPSPYSFVWSGITPGVYQLTAKAYDSLGAMAASNIVSITVNPSITVIQGVNGTITPTGNANGIVVVAINGNQAFNIAATGANVITDVKVDNVSVGAVTSYTFNNVIANHTITATFNAVPGAPVANTATLPTTTGFTANWGAVANATSYSLDVSTNNSLISFVTGYNNLNVGNVTSFNVTGLAPGATYYYRVRANIANVVSANSNLIAAGTLVNVALQTNGGVASASSSYSGYAAPAVNNGDRLGLNFSNGGIWADNTPTTYPDWVQITFSSTKSVSEIDVFTMQDNFTNPVTPFVGQTFSSYGTGTYDVQYWNGASWVTVPGGSVVNNNQVWNKFTFAPVVTDQIRVVVNGSNYPYSYFAEIEAWSAPDIITVVQGANGTITPTGDVHGNILIAAGGSQTCTITPSGTNVITDVKVDNVSVGAVPTYTFSNLTTDHTITATFGAAGSLGTPVATAATAITGTGFAANWGTAASATSYLLDVSTSNTFATFVAGYSSLNVGNVTTFAVTSLTPNTTYYYRVRGNNVNGPGANSNMITAVTTAIAVTPINVALQANGGIATASSNFTGYPATAVNNGDRAGLNYLNGGIWADNTPGTFPDWVQITFNGTKSISEIDVFTMQDNLANPVTPTASQTFATYGVKAFDVQYWNGANWVTVTGGSITNNNLVWNKITFAPVSTDRIRVVSNSASTPYSYFTEIEAWNAAAVTPPPALVLTVTQSANGTITPAGDASGNIQVASGGSQTFNITPTGANIVTDVKVDNVSIGAVTTYTFSNVTVNHTITATFGAAGPVGTPVATAATALAGTGFSANWGAAAVATSYLLDVSTSNTFATFVAGYNGLNVGNVTTFAVTNLAPSTTYYYQVRASNVNGPSVNSNMITAVTTANTGTPVNVALQANGGVATASSTFTGYPATAVNNGDRAGLNYNSGGIWADNTPGAFPDWVQITFNGTKSISEIDVFTIQDNIANPVTPTANQTFATYGVKAFDVQYWNGTNWVTVTGGSITNNNLVWNKITFTPVSTDRIRVVSNGAGTPYSYFAEIEAWSAAAVTPPPALVLTVTQSANGTITPAGDASGNIQVASGGSQTFNITPTGANIVTDVKVDNVSIGAVTTYTFSNVTVNHTITATFGAAGPVGTPVATAATALAGTSFSANWGAAAGATSYLLDVSTSNTFATFVAGYNGLNVGNVTTFAVTNLAPSTTYYYQVRASNVNGPSVNSNMITAVTPANVVTPINVALQANGGIATASSNFTGYPATAVNNGDRAGLNYSSGGIWADNTPGAFPDWVQITFNGTKSISEIDVFTMQDNLANPVTPTASQTFATYGVKAFDVQYWNGTNWVTVTGGSITNNNLVWNKITFAPVSTDRIRVVSNSASTPYSYFAEIEAWGL